MNLRRIFAALIAAMAVVGLAWQVRINGAKPGLSVVGIRIWLMWRYFTNLTAAMVVVRMVSKAFGHRVRAIVAVTVTLSVIMVGTIYRRFIATSMTLPLTYWYPDFLLRKVVSVAVPLW